MCSLLRSCLVIAMDLSFHCSKCDKFFGSALSLNMHMMRMHRCRRVIKPSTSDCESEPAAAGTSSPLEMTVAPTAPDQTSSDAASVQEAVVDECVAGRKRSYAEVTASPPPASVSEPSSPVSANRVASLADPSPAESSAAAGQPKREARVQSGGTVAAASSRVSTRRVVSDRSSVAVRGIRAVARSAIPVAVPVYRKNAHLHAAGQSCGGGDVPVAASRKSARLEAAGRSSGGPDVRAAASRGGAGKRSTAVSVPVPGCRTSVCCVANPVNSPSSRELGEGTSAASSWTVVTRRGSASRRNVAAQLSVCKTARLSCVSSVSSATSVASSASEAVSDVNVVTSSVSVCVPGKKGVQCCICKRYFPNSVRLSGHQRDDHPTQYGGPTKSTTTSTITTSGNTKSFSGSKKKEKTQCELCHNWFLNLQRHHCSRRRKKFQLESKVNSGNNDVKQFSVPELPKTVNRLDFSPQGSHAGISRKCDNREMVAKEFAELNKLKKRCQKQIAAAPEDPLLTLLTDYHNSLSSSATSLVTERVSPEVLSVISDPTKIDDVRRQYTWSKADEARLNGLNTQAKALQIPSHWTWAAKDGSLQHEYNNKRMNFYVRNELETVIKTCNNCKSTGILVGLEQNKFECCRDCSFDRRPAKVKREFFDEWAKVRPMSQTYHNLPDLCPGERSVISLYQPVVTVRKNYMFNKKLRQESITLLNDTNQTWTKILPRTDLHDRFLVIERTTKDHSRKHIVANPARVRIWLRYLFRNHPEFIRKQRDGELELSDAALSELEKQSELGEVVDDLEYEKDDDDSNDGKRGDGNVLTQPELESGFSSTDIFTFDRYPYLYLKAKDFMRIKQGGQIEIVEDHQTRMPIYNISSTISFPYLYLHGERSPLDVFNYRIARDLLKRQSLFAYLVDNGRYRWEYAADDVHMMHQYAKLVERTISAKTCWYLTQSPDIAHLPMEVVINAFKSGFAENDQTLIDSKLPGLSSIMAELPNSRERWYAEQMALNAMARDIGDPNLFVTLNNSPRDTYDTRLLLHKLEFGNDAVFDPNWYEHNSERFTDLMNKHAVHMSVYLYMKTKLFLRAFFTDVCGVSETKPTDDWLGKDNLSAGYYWSRVEFTNTRGTQHWHTLVKLPHVLDTSLIGRMIQNGRMVRQEIKCGNISSGKEENAWTIVEVGLLANRYATLFADSLSMASFYTEPMDVDRHDPSKIVNINDIRKQFVQDCKDKNLNMSTHPLMRRHGDPECDENPCIEMAKVAAVSCIHNCISTICGGDPKTGDGCRFNFPMRLLNHTVPAMMQVNSSQMEARMLLRRTADRVPNLNSYFLLYWRGNHDVTVLVDAAHKMRYASKYASKSGRYSELLNEVIEYLSNRSLNGMPANMQTVLSQLLLADVSHRAFMTKQELAYHVMGLPSVIQTFNRVEIVGFYRRATITFERDGQELKFSDRTCYSAYAERMNIRTKVNTTKKDGVKLTNDVLRNMCYREFAETVSYQWHQDKEPETPTLHSKRKHSYRDIGSGHWVLRLRPRRAHIRWSTVLYTDLATLYDKVDREDLTDASFFNLTVDKRRQLYRGYMEMVCYLPWTDSPDETLF